LPGAIIIFPVKTNNPEKNQCSVLVIQYEILLPEILILNEKDQQINDHPSYSVRTGKDTQTQGLAVDGS
jgi:hypothetical protein